MQENNKNISIIVAISAIALSFGIWFGLDFHGAEQKTNKTEEIQGILLNPAKQLPDFTFIDNKKHSFSRDNLKNTWSIMFFGYTHCPDVCPTTLQTLRRVDEKLEQMQVVPPQVIFVTVDPQRDNAETLDRYVRYFNNDFIGLTGSPDGLEKLAAALGVYYRKAAGASGDLEADDYAMDHTAALLVINPQGNVAALLSPPHEVDRIIQDLRVIVQYDKKSTL
ncbi:MAG TPA: SCO family protein [Gammaproteobacteria bacterium]|nr:SCO family protein [Gammaproteobacteria bacterium]